MSALPDPMHAVLALVARRPLLPVAHMALMLKQDRRELQVRLGAATRLGWLSAERACCGREDRYIVTEAGLAAFSEAHDRRKVRAPPTSPSPPALRA